MGKIITSVTFRSPRHWEACGGVLMVFRHFSAPSKNGSKMTPGTAGVMQEYCRSTAGKLQEYCRRNAGVLRELCRRTAGVLQENCRNTAEEM